MKKSLGAKILIFPTPVWCVGTYDSNGKPNVMTVAWGGVCCSKPPCIAVSLRKATYTYASLMEKKAFTISVPSARHAAEADFFGIASGRDTDKWKMTGLNPVRSGVVDAPYVAEFPLVIELKLVNHLELGLHTLFVGEVLDVKADEEILDESGKPSVETVKPFVYSPEVGVYHGLGEFIGKGFSMGKSFRATP